MPAQFTITRIGPRAAAVSSAADLRFVGHVGRGEHATEFGRALITRRRRQVDDHDARTGSRKG
jgi:hypothetical protein